MSDSRIIGCMKFLTISVLFLSMLGCTIPAKVDGEKPLKIWFDEPTNDWNKGLPIGNGSLGAMIYGSPTNEIITLNEETIWSGEKRYDRDKKDGHKHLAKIQDLLFEGKYEEAEKLTQEKLLGERLQSGTQAYQMLGQLRLDRLGLDSISNYQRALNINEAVANTSYEINGITFTSEYFSSFPDQVMVVKYTADKKGSISFNAAIERTAQTDIIVKDNAIHFSEHVGNGVGVKFHAIVHFEPTGGTIQANENGITIANSDEVVIRIVATSDYRGGDPKTQSELNLKKALVISYQELKDKHISDYQSLFDRVAFQIGEPATEHVPTDVRLDSVKAGKADHYLTQLQYQFGRYLLISSSRPGTLPANLQGIWVNGFKPPWNSDYHININLQMNYWMAEMANLPELHKPLLDYIGELRELGRITARETYGARGWVAHHTSDAWHMTAGFGKAKYGMWSVGGAWLCQHLFTHYEYTEDIDYLRDYAYPIMRESAMFFVDFMVTDPKTGLLVSGPSTSPENAFYTKEGKQATINMGPTMDREIILELFSNCIASAEILGIEDDFTDTLKSKMKLIPRIQIGSDGRLMEWVEEFEEWQPGHRHISHLYALHPSNQISKSRTPELFEAAKKTIEFRLASGGGHTGWSRAWIINFYARLLEGDKAYENILALQRKSTLPNLLDMHPPFQIDGNFGIVSGITEMLMQSHDGEISILPALPTAWSDGAIKGILARKGFEIDMEWQAGQLKTLTVSSQLGSQLDLRYGTMIKSLETNAGETLTFDKEMNLINQ